MSEYSFDEPIRTPAYPTLDSDVVTNGIVVSSVKSNTGINAFLPTSRQLVSNTDIGTIYVESSTYSHPTLGVILITESSPAPNDIPSGNSSSVVVFFMMISDGGRSIIKSASVFVNC